MCSQRLKRPNFAQRWAEIRHLPGLEYKTFAKGSGVEKAAVAGASTPKPAGVVPRLEAAARLAPGR